MFEIASSNSKKFDYDNHNTLLYSPEFGKGNEFPENRESSETKKTAPQRASHSIMP